MYSLSSLYKQAPSNPAQISVRGFAGPMGPTPELDPEAQEKTEWIAKSREQFRQSQESESQERARWLDDLKFYDGQQWPEKDESDRVQAGRPALVFNRQPSFVHAITNEERQSRPQPKVSPVGDGADVDTAEIFEGVIRHIEVNSDAEVAYDTGGEHAAIFGFGVIRVLSEYVDGTVDQELIVSVVDNPFSVYIDPSAKKPDRRDMRWCIITENVERSKFKEMYPKAECTGLSDFQGIGDAERWYGGDFIRVAEKYWIEDVYDDVCLLANGEHQWRSEIEDEAEIVESRPGSRPLVRWRKFTAVEVLDETTWPGRYIPVVPVFGEALCIDGKWVIQGIVRRCRAPQQAFNYAETQLVETLMQAPKNPWVAEEGQIEDYEQLYQNANRDIVAVLPYKAVSDTSGAALPPPQRNTAEPPIQAAAVAAAHAEQSMKAGVSLFDPSLGQGHASQSGEAIRGLQAQGNTGSYNYPDNLNRAIKHVGRILVDAAPKIYRRPGRLQRIIDPDGSHRMVLLGKPFEQTPQGPKPVEMDQYQEGVHKFYDITTGRYDITISVGPSYQTRRQEAAAQMVELVRANPAVWPLIGHLVVKFLDWPESQEISKILKQAAQKQGILPPDQEPGQQANPEQMQAEMQKSQMIIKLLTDRLQQLEFELKAKLPELESKERQTTQSNITKILAAEIGAKSGEMQKLAQLDHDAVEHMLDQRQETLHAEMTIEADAAQQQQAQQAQQQAQPQQQPQPAQ